MQFQDLNASCPLQKLIIFHAKEQKRVTSKFVVITGVVKPKEYLIVAVGYLLSVLLRVSKVNVWIQWAIYSLGYAHCLKKIHQKGEAEKSVVTKPLHIFRDKY